MGPRWAERAADELDRALCEGEISNEDYHNEMRGLRDEVNEAAEEIADDYRGGW